MIGKKRRINRFDRWMMAVTFAEAGDPETALDLLSRKPRKRDRRFNRRRPERRADHRPTLMT